MFQASELITLTYGLIALAVAVGLSRRLSLPGLPWIMAGLAGIVAAYVFTVVEGVWSHTFFNHLEHLGYAWAAVAFTIGLATWQRHGAPPGGPATPSSARAAGEAPGGSMRRQDPR